LVSYTQLLFGDLNTCRRRGVHPLGEGDAATLENRRRHFGGIGGVLWGRRWSITRPEGKNGGLVVMAAAMEARRRMCGRQGWRWFGQVSQLFSRGWRRRCLSEVVKSKLSGVWKPLFGKFESALVGGVCCRRWRRDSGEAAAEEWVVGVVWVVLGCFSGAGQALLRRACCIPGSLLPKPAARKQGPRPGGPTQI